MKKIVFGSMILLLALAAAGCSSTSAALPGTDWQVVHLWEHSRDCQVQIQRYPSQRTELSPGGMAVTASEEPIKRAAARLPSPWDHPR